MAAEGPVGIGHTQLIIKNAMREISEECEKRGYAVSETLVAFILKATILNPSHNYDVDNQLDGIDVERLLKLCVDCLTDDNDVPMDTVRMQVSFDQNYLSRNDLLREHRSIKTAARLPPLREILDARPRVREDFESFYRLLVNFIITASPLTSPEDMAIMRETTAALQSVLPQTELSTLLKLSRDQKESQLIELMHIVTGIRLYNKKIGKGGAGIDNLAGIFLELLPALQEKLEASIAEGQRICDRITALMEKDSMSGNTHQMDPGDYEAFAEAAANCRQKEAFLHILGKAIEDCEKAGRAHLDKYYAELEAITGSVTPPRKSVATKEIYPKFQELARAWTGVQEETRLLSIYESTMSGVNSHGKVVADEYTEEKLANMLSGVEVLSDAQRLEKSGASEERIEEPLSDQVRIYRPEQIVNFPEMTTEYRGFCALSLSNGNGMLLRGNPQLGIVSYREKYYAFSSATAARAFAFAPLKHTSVITTLCQMRPYLIPLLEMHSTFSSMTAQKLGLAGAAPKTRCDAGVQTEVHAPTRCFVKSYEWNEWILRAQASKLANIRQTVTKSTQTTSSGFRRDADTQVYLPKDNSTQTRRDKATAVPKPVVYMAGLRGSAKNTAKPAKVDLTPDIVSHRIADDMEPKNH